MDWAREMIVALPRGATLLAELAPVFGGALVSAAGYVYARYLKRHAHDRK